jgi:glycerol-3-phosphate dehydrogenase
VLTPGDTKRIFQNVDVASLRGGAVWYDACIPDSQRVVMEILRWACAMGAKNLNYVKVNSLNQHSGQVIGVSATDKFSGETLQFNSPVVVNATGPWSRITAETFDQDVESLFCPSIAWNILLDRPTLSDHVLAVAPKRPGAQMYFLHPWKGKILAGTGHKPWSGGPDNPKPTKQQVSDFLQDINTAIPGLNLGDKDIVRVFAGLLPAQDQSGAGLATREVILDHEDVGGPSGLFSISGVKFTTSRLVAEKTIKLVLNKHSKRFRVTPALVSVNRPAIQTGWDMSAAAIIQHEKNTDWKEILTRIINQESVMHLDDLVLRRTTLWEDVKCVDIAPMLCSLFNWDDKRQIQELNRLNLQLKTKVAA